MQAITLLATAITRQSDCPILPCLPREGICAITGLSGPCVPRQELLGKSFTNGDLLARPESGMVSVEAYYALKYKWERMNSWFTDGVVFERLMRQDVRTKVFQKNLPAQWSGYVTTSYKKHGSLNAKVNFGQQRIWLFEMRLVDCTHMGMVCEWWDILNVALRAGIGRSVMESLDCPSSVMSKVGLRKWRDFEAWACPKYLSGLYAFLCYLLPSQEELKHENDI